MHSRLKTIIVEDETLARNRLKRLLAPYTHEIELIGEAENGKRGLELIEALKPDLVFLDIQMPLLSGFEMLSHLSFQPYIIFTTAYDQYALKAFEKNSIDYLLKPIKEERVKKSIDKLIALKNLGQNNSQEIEGLQDLIRHLKQPKRIKSIKVNIGDRIEIIDIDNIIFFKAEDKLTKVVTISGKDYWFDPSLKKLEEKLPEHFIRLNRSHLVNDNHVSTIRKGFKGRLIYEMKNKEKTKITSSTTYTSSIRKRWEL